MDIEIQLKDTDRNGFFMDRLLLQPDVLHQIPSSPKGMAEALFFAGHCPSGKKGSDAVFTLEK